LDYGCSTSKVSANIPKFKKIPKLETLLVPSILDKGHSTYTTNNSILTNKITYMKWTNY
jgi:hypothetical protein